MARRRQRRPRPPIQAPLASMGDLAFLLIIFFMLCSNFMKTAGAKVKPPDAPGLETLQETPITVTIDEESKVYLQGYPVTDANTLEAGVAALLEGREGDSQRTVIFRCDREVDRSVFEPVIEAIAKAGAVLAPVGDLDKPSQTTP